MLLECDVHLLKVKHTIGHLLEAVTICIEQRFCDGVFKKLHHTRKFWELLVQDLDDCIYCADNILAHPITVSVVHVEADGNLHVCETLGHNEAESGAITRHKLGQGNVD